SFEKIGLTLSIGVGFGAEDYTKINELASSALDVALSRGGNQCVIYPFGANMVFLGGGNSESRFSTSKVKIKTFARSFAASLANQTNVLIVPHNYADVDAIGACLGVYTICKSINNSINARIIYSDEAVEKTADLAIRTMLPSYFFDEVFVSFKTANEIKKKDALIVVVDHNKPELSIYPELYLGGDNKIAIIDHHRKTDDAFDSVVFEHIDSSASSTCELLSLYFDSYSFKMNISSEIATLMLAGIYLDTTNFKMHTSIGTHEASIILSRLGADEVKARDLLKESYETFALKSKIISSLEMPENGVIIVKAPEEDLVNTTLLAIVCNELRDVQGTQVCFAIGKTSEDDVNISSRSDGSVNCELLMQKLGGGGHFSAAACKLENVTIEEAENKLKHVLDEYLKDAMSSDRKHEDEGE
ncbi:MAG: DHH family phosphoesterase, partial [Bacilli bacterium]|nr:DHH family phosphoesterase [Bacilli bacterium]